MIASLRPLPGPVTLAAGAFDLARLGYTEQEFLLTGTAGSYELAGPRTPDGRWSVRPALRAPFTTRVVVRQPADSGSFSGTVLVEWLNVSGGLDAAPDWMMAHTELIRSGHAWAGVSAQRAGIEGGGLVPGPHLKKSHPARYSELSHPGDAWAFDIFSQAGHALRAEPGILPAPVSSRPLRLLAGGQSQSAAFLVTYINGIDPLAGVYDGFLVHGRTGSGAALDIGFRPGASTTGVGERIRADLRVPVVVLQTETDVVLLGSGLVQQQDHDLLRNWELAGAAHADTYLLFASGQDDGHLPPARLAELLRPTTSIVMGQTESPINSGPQHHYVACTAVAQLDAWVAGRGVPPAAPRLDVAAGRDLRRDELGRATGGIRTPWTDVPVAILSGTGQKGELFAFLFGTTRSLTDAELARLYPGGRADYLGRFQLSLDAAIKAGFLLPADRAEILAVAGEAWPA